MSYRLYFDLSQSLSKTMKVPQGTHDKIWQHIRDTEEILGLKRTPAYTPEGEPPKPGWHWYDSEAHMLTTAGPEVDRSMPQRHLADRSRDEQIEGMATRVLEHNDFVRTLYKDLVEWSKQKNKKGDWEQITIAQSVEFWGGLHQLELPRALWTRDYFRDRIEHLYEVLRRGEHRGTIYNGKPLSIKQASEVIHLFEDQLDQWDFDLRLTVPLDEHLKPYDHLVCSYDGGYDWCSDCGPIHSEDFGARCAACPRAKKGNCELKNDHPAEFEDDE